MLQRLSAVFVAALCLRLPFLDRSNAAYIEDPSIHIASEGRTNARAGDTAHPLRHGHPHFHQRHSHEEYGDTATLSNSSGLMRRDDYSCGPGKPCSNGACCGSGGYCGYGDFPSQSTSSDLANDVAGDTYCGDGCVSNCDALAECGKDASPSGKKCPLNVWYTNLPPHSDS